MVAPDVIRVVRCGGSRLNYRRAVFTTDSRYLLCVSGDYIRVFSTTTEECLHVLQGHSNLVTGIQLNPQNHLQLYSCSLDGSIKLWDFMDGILIKTFHVGLKLHALYTLTTSKDSVFVLSPLNHEETDVFQLVCVKLPKSTEQEVEANETSVILEDITRSPRCTAFGRDGQFVASGKSLRLCVYFFKKKMLNSFSLSATDKKGAKNKVTSVACHPKEDCIATGHEDGRIRLWRNFHHKKEYTFSSLHWHHDRVMDLIFSTEGTSLLSGGIESVLVQWRYGAEMKKEFMPRIGATIEHIAAASDGTLYCTSHSDNKIVLIQANLKVSAVIQGLVKGDEVKTGLIVDPRTQALVLNGKPGQLQFYSLQRDKQLYNLDIVQQEHIHESGLRQVEIVKASFSPRGIWLATIEQRQEKEVEEQMKLWEYDETKQCFVLNTTINMPHEDNVTAMCFSEADDFENDIPTLVTAGKDGRFKVWILNDESDIYRQSTGWSCDFVGTYHNYQATNCCFSEDGSLLAVSFEEIVTVWEYGTWDLKCTFCHPPSKIRSLCFGRLNCSKFLIGATHDEFLCCWNLLSCELQWSAQLNVIVLQPDPLSENIVAVSWVSGNSDLFVFKPDEPRPLYVQKSVCRGKIQWAVFVPRNVPESVSSESHQWLNRSQLYLLTVTQDLMTFSTKSPEDQLTPFSKQLAAEESLPLTPLQLLLGKKREQDQNNSDRHLGRVSSRKIKDSVAIKELLQTPAHVLPPASILCSLFVNSLLISKASHRQEVPDEVEMESEEGTEESDEELDFTPVEQEVISCNADDTAPKLSKNQERELRRLRKIDYSWVTNLLI